MDRDAAKVEIAIALIRANPDRFANGRTYTPTTLANQVRAILNALEDED